MDRSTRVITDQSAVTMTATVTGTAYLVERYTELSATIQATAVAGTPTLDAVIETAPTDSGPWATLASFAQLSTVASILKTATVIGQWIRLKYVIAGGSPSVTLNSYITLKN